MSDKRMLILDPETGIVKVRIETEEEVSNFSTILKAAQKTIPTLLPPILDNTWVYLNGDAAVFVERLEYLPMNCHVTSVAEPVAITLAEPAAAPATVRTQEVITPTFISHQETVRLPELRWIPPADMALLLVGSHPKRLRVDSQWTIYIVALDLRADGMVYMLPIPNQYAAGNICLGSGNYAFNSPTAKQGWLNAKDHVKKLISHSEWAADSLFMAAVWRTTGARAMFRWQNAEGYPQLPLAGEQHWTSHCQTVSIGTINEVLRELQPSIALPPPTEKVKSDDSKDGGVL